MASVDELRSNWQSAQAAADTAYAAHLSASGQAALSWGGNRRLISASYSASRAWKDADQLADLAFEKYRNARAAEISASKV
jgi:hypothetical protein